MTNKEKYKQAFSVLHTSDISEGEVKYMAKLRKQQKMKLAAAAIAVCVIVGGTGTAYAANVGGIQRTIQLWMHGDQTSATLDLNTDNGSYSLEYKDTDGNTVTQGGGGVAFDADGNERPLTEDEIMEELNAPENISMMTAYGFIIKIRKSKSPTNSTRTMSAMSKSKTAMKQFT